MSFYSNGSVGKRGCVDSLKVCFVVVGIFYYLNGSRVFINSVNKHKRPDVNSA